MIVVSATPAAANAASTAPIVLISNPAAGRPLPPHMFPYQHEGMGIVDGVHDVQITQEGLKGASDQLFVSSTLLSRQLQNYGSILKQTSKNYVKLMGLVGDTLNQESTGLITDEKDRLGSMSAVTEEIEKVTKLGVQDPSDAKLPDAIVEAASLKHIDEFESEAGRNQPTEWHPQAAGTPGMTPAVTPAVSPGMAQSSSMPNLLPSTPAVNTLAKPSASSPSLTSASSPSLTAAEKPKPLKLSPLGAD